MRKIFALSRRGSKLSAVLAGSAVAVAVAAGPASAAVTGSIVATGLNSPGGTVTMGTHQWVADHVNGFCRLDANATGKLAINPATCSTAALSPGQPSFDPVSNSVYVPDNSTKGTGVYRLTFNPVTETVRTSALLGSNVIPAGNKPTSTALSADGSALYVGSIRGGNIVKVANPATSIAGQNIGRTSDGRGASGLTIANHSDGTPGSSLYIAEGGGISELDLATTGSVATLTGIAPQSVVGGKAIIWETLDVVAASPNVLYVAKWAPHDLGTKVTITQYTLNTATGVDYSTTYTAADGKPQPWTTVTDLALNPAGGLFVSHDPSNGGTNGAALSKIA